MESRDFIDPNQLAQNIPTSTPNEKTEIKLDGQNFEININDILSLLENTVQKHFNTVDYSFLTTAQSLLSHFYYNEKECLSKIKENSYSKKKFYKNLIYESIAEIFNQAPEKLTKEIFEGIEKIRENLDKKEKKGEKINLEVFYNLSEEIFGTKDLPKFLVKNDLKYIKFRENYQKKVQKPEQEEIVSYYQKIESGQLKPFDYIRNKGKLFDVFVLSNATDIENNDIINDIFLQNYKDILSWFNLDMNTRGYDYVYTNFIKITEMEKNGLLEDLFIPLNIELNQLNDNKENLLFILISSFFYCIIFKMKEEQNKNNIYEIKEKKKENNSNININNSRITKFFSNVVNSFSTYLQNSNYNIKNLVNSLYIYVMQNNNISESGTNSSISITENNHNSNSNNNIIFSREENIDYDFKLIEELIMQSDDNNTKERFKAIKAKLSLEPYHFSPTLIGTFLKRVVNVFTSKICYYANFIRLSPFQRYVSSNTVTILISGFGSENDIHSIEWRKYIESAPMNTNYYFYHWPGDSLSKIIVKSLPLGKLDSDLPQVFLESKKKAVICGKMLALIIRSDKFFGNRQVNLVAFSLGNHVVKNCIKELSNYNDCKCIINDVTLIAGATTLKNKINWYNRFKKVVGGRIVNCYSEKDYVLKLLYSNCTGNYPIGSHEVFINDGLDGNNIVENYDFTDLNLGHLDYRKKFNEIIKRINSYK